VKAIARLALALAISSLAADAVAADPTETANDCVGFQNEPGDKLLLVHARNSCERRLSCTLEYTVLCEDVNGKQTSRAAKRTSFQLDKNASQDLSLSAAACAQGWRIDDVSWSCR